MGKLNVYYRGFKDYRKSTLNNTACRNERKLIKKSNLDLDVLNSTKYLCKINDDWIKAIEEGLPFIDKAILEERQFIRSEGEIIPIEKVKKVSRSSVEHLAKHSDMITHVPEDEDQDLVPDKLFMVEKYSDYAVYENRFLYMLLYYLNEFIYFRLSKIEELRGTYVGNMSFKKDNASKTREFSVEVNVHEKVLNNPYPLKDDECDSLIQRIKDIQQIVASYLNRSLIVEVSKAPMIKPPIVKTNVLKMNNNFKRALALYEFISTYKGLGYTYEEVKTELNPFNETVADEISELSSLSLFLSYKHNNDLEEILENEYQNEEKIRLEEEQKQLVARLERLKKRAKEDGKSLEEYMLLLEQRNTQLERDSEELGRCQNEIIVLNNKINDLTMEKNHLKHQMDVLNDQLLEKLHEINRLNQKYIDDLNVLRMEHEEEIKNIELKHEAHINELKNNNDQIIEQLKQENTNTLNMKDEYYNLKIKDVQNEYELNISKLNNDNLEQKEELNNRINSLNSEISDHINKRNELINEYENKLKDFETKSNNLLAQKDNTNTSLNEHIDLLKAEIRALKVQLGEVTPSEDYTSREKFMELEKEFQTFNNYFEKQWNMTKEQIKREILSTASIKEKLNKDKEDKKLNKQSKEKKSFNFKKNK